MSSWLPQAASAISILMMGAAGMLLTMRLARMLRGGEDTACSMRPCRSAPACEILAAAGIMLLSRFAVYAVSLLMHRMTGGMGAPGQVIAWLWNRWDARHYISIAQNGYTSVGDERLLLVFFPLYPLLMRLTALVTGGNLFAAGAAVSLACACACAGLLYELAYSLYGRRCAVLASAYFMLSPLSVFLCSAYTEALFICLTLAALVLHRRGRPWAAAICGMLSAFTRMPGVLCAGLYLIDLLKRAGQRRLTLPYALRCAAQMAVVFAGFGAYLAVNAFVTGDPFMYLTYQRENWFQQAGTFWRSVENTAYYFATGMGESDWLYTWGFQLLCMFYVFGLLLFGQGKLPFHLAAYNYVYTAVVLAPTWLLSGARYLYALAPLPLLQARAHKSAFWHALALTLHAVLLPVWIYGFTIAVEVL